MELEVQLALKAGDLASLNHEIGLLRGANRFGTRDERKKTLLHYIAETRDADKADVKKFIDKVLSEGLDIEGREPLESGSKRPNDTPTVFVDDPTPLYLAASKDLYETVAHLIVRGANIGHKNMGAGLTALHCAVLHNCFDTAWTLIVRGRADVNELSAEGESCLHYAIHGDCDLKMFELLICHGSKLNARGQRNESPLHLLSKQSKIAHDKLMKIAVLFIVHGANTNSKDASDERPGDSSLNKLDRTAIASLKQKTESMRQAIRDWKTQNDNSLYKKDSDGFVPAVFPDSVKDFLNGLFPLLHAYEEENLLHFRSARKRVVGETQTDMTVRPPYRPSGTELQNVVDDTRPQVPVILKIKRSEYLPERHWIEKLLMRHFANWRDNKVTPITYGAGTAIVAVLFFYSLYS